MRNEEERRAIEAMGRAELEEEVLRLRRQLERTEGLETTLLSTMSHELKTPLNAILGFTDVLLQGLSGSLTDTQTRQLESVDRSAKRLMELVNDVLDLSKAQMGKLELSRDEFDLSLSIRKVFGEVVADAERRGLKVSLSQEDGTERALGDRRRTEQVLRHLLSNAVKFTESGSVSLEASRNDSEIFVLIKDTGIGIAPEEISRLFQPFRQLDAGRSRHYEGLGLGLSLSKYFIEGMGGRIWAESSPGSGSTFGFSLLAGPS